MDLLVWALMFLISIGGMYWVSPAVQKGGATLPSWVEKPEKPIEPKKKKKKKSMVVTKKPAEDAESDRTSSEDEGPENMDEDEILMSMVKNRGRTGAFGRGRPLAVAKPSPPDTSTPGNVGPGGAPAANDTAPSRGESSGSDTESWVIASSKPRGVSKQFGSASSLDSGLEGGGTVWSGLGDADEGWEAVPRSTPKPPRAAGGPGGRPPVAPATKAQTQTATQKRNEKRREKKELLRTMQQQGGKP